MSRRHGLQKLSQLDAKVFRRGRTVLLGSMPFYVPADPHFFGYIIGHEPHVRGVIASCVHPGDTVIDAGANIGYFTMMMASACSPGGRVVAFEPEPYNYSVLARNAGEARRAGIDILPVQAAVSSCEGWLELERGAESTLHTVRQQSMASRGEVVKAVRIDDYVTAHVGEHFISLVKIDVEGHESEALMGMTKLLQKGLIGTIVVEVTPGQTAREVVKFAHDNDLTYARCWVDQRWVDMPVQEISDRTDVIFRPSRTMLTGDRS